MMETARSSGNPEEKAVDDESMEAMVATLFREEEDDDEEIRQLQAHIRILAAKVEDYSANGPALISSRLQSYLQHRRPTFTLDPLQDALSESEFLDPGLDDDDPSIVQAKMLKSKIVSLTESIPALVQRMKACLDACDKKQRLAEESKPPLPCFLQDVQKVWEALSPRRR
ncbi:hypothetical protein KP509_09G087900 [Ceratopteris richardii]|uniref:Uncharacterized protein n=1 Tax=Ceratopteris richardii TaxID=49495 RepID=A0A8T2U676_CERRI|nr:hypothetical protein KP509_09G087900 [Ceratopteris richardii]